VEYYEDLMEILEHGKGSKVDRATSIVQLIQQAPGHNRGSLLRMACENWDTAESDNSVILPSLVSEDDVKQLKEKNGKLVDSLLEGIIAGNPSEDDFYQRLWEVINSAVFHEEKVRYFALYWVLIDMRIPYFCLSEGISMSNDRYKELSNKLGMRRAKIRFVAKRSFDQKTQQASLLLEELDQVSGEERVVLMAYLITLFKGDTDIGKLLGGLAGLLSSDD
jgi:hypothetical protein